MILETAVTLVLSSELFMCGQIQAVGCFDPNTNTITISTSVDGETFKNTLIHEFAHSKYNHRADLPDVFDQLPSLVGEFDPIQEKMAWWFVYFWKYWPAAIFKGAIEEFFFK